MDSAFIIVVDWVENICDDSISSGTSFSGVALTKESIEKAFNTQIEEGKKSLVEEINNFYDGDKEITIDDIKVKKYYDDSVKIFYKDGNVKFSYEYKISTTDFYE